MTTGGAPDPSLTIVALVIRQAESIADLLGNGRPLISREPAA
jgi:hypothetical protein